MKNLFLFIATRLSVNVAGLFLSSLTFFSTAAYGQSVCNDETILDTKGSWKKRPDVLMRSGSPAQTTATMEAIGNLFKMSYPEPRGMEASWYKSMDGNPVIKEGPGSYQVNSLYQAWYCNRNLHKLVLGDETGTWAYVFVNGFSWFISDQRDLLSIKVNGDAVYLLPPVKGEWKGYPLYQASSHGDKGSCIVLTHNNQLPWKPVTQEQYLQAVRGYMEQQQRGSDNSYTPYEENLKRRIGETQNKKNLNQADKDKAIAGLQKEFDDLEKRKTEDIAKSAKRWNEKFGLIDAYRSAHADLLQQPAIIERGYENDFTGAFATQNKGGQMLITVDSAYFNKRLPRYAAQFIVLYWRWDTTAPGLNFKKEFEGNFPVDRLKGLIDK